jgi:hypothetical protein
MSTKMFLASIAFGFLIALPVVRAEQKPAPPVSNAQEFPVQMRQNVVAGKTPVGTKFEATLTLATLIGGKVVPEGAIFSGVVVESAAKSVNSPSRLSMRIDSVRWKSGSASITAYLTAWYYPAVLPPPDNAGGGPFGANGEGKRTWAGYNPNVTDQVIFPGRSPDRLPEPAPPQSSDNTEHRVAMKNVETMRAGDAAIVLSSSHSTIKLDRGTTYVLATGNVTPVK